MATPGFSSSHTKTTLGDLPVPPPALRYHVFSRNVTDDEFLEAGRLCADSLEAALARQGRAMSDFARVLDFGCGSARVLRHFAPLFTAAEFHGTDVAESVIAWNQANIAGATFHQNAEVPPLAFSDGFFDGLWSISVFSHLPEPMALAWLEDLKRVLRPGGIALITVHGQFRFDEASRPGGCITPDAAREYEDRGFTYVPAFKDGILPDWYQNAFMTEVYARRTFGHHFQVLDYIPRGMMGRQDIVVVEHRRA